MFYVVADLSSSSSSSLGRRTRPANPKGRARSACSRKNAQSSFRQERWLQSLLRPRRAQDAAVRAEGVAGGAASLRSFQVQIAPASAVGT